MAVVFVVKSPIPDTADDNFSGSTVDYDKWEQFSYSSYRDVPPYIVSDKLQMYVLDSPTTGNKETYLRSRFMGKAGEEFSCTIEFDFTYNVGVDRAMWRIMIGNINLTNALQFGFHQAGWLHSGKRIDNVYSAVGNITNDVKYTKFKFFRTYTSGGTVCWLGGHVWDNVAETWTNMFYGASGPTHSNYLFPYFINEPVYLNLVAIADLSPNAAWMKVNYDNYIVSTPYEDLTYNSVLGPAPSF